MNSHCNDAYLMDMENYALSKWDCQKCPFPTGVGRCENQKWMEHISLYIDYGGGKSKEEALQEYKDWVKNGGGDEWFLG